ncbi:MAG TPA: DUF1761 domain-containing protein [Flavobacterium sp.]|nr:DUF1761 domain-containing protein [Flavobacterium sp.]
MELNFYSVFASGLVTLFLGFIWYHPKIFGTAWMREAKLTQEELSKGSMLKIFLLTFIFSLMIGLVMQPIIIHQFGALGMIGGGAFIETAKPSYAQFMADYGTAYRTFKHGALHGFITGLFLAFPMAAITGLFERKSWKYILINAGYWILSLTAIGAIISGWV